MAATPPHPEDGSAAGGVRAAQRDTVRIPAGRPESGRAESGRMPARRGGDRATGGRQARLPVVAVVVTTWAALVSALPVAAIVALAQLADAPTVTLAGVVRYGLAGWLLGHGVPLATGLGPIGLTPVAVLALASWRLARAGVHVTRAIGARHSGSLGRAGQVAFAVGVAYGCLGTLAAFVARGPGLAIAPPRAGLTLGVVGFGAALWGALGATGAGDRLLARAPAVLRDGARTGLVASLLVLGAGGALAGTALAFSAKDASETLATYRTGVAGQAGLTLVCAAYAPNVAVWSASYLIGPGFAVGVDTSIRTSDVTVGALPAVPVFAALPSGSVGNGFVVLLGAPLAAGMTAGWLLARRHRRRGSLVPRRGVTWVRLLLGAALAGPVAGVLLGLAAYVSAGPLGAGRLATMGPVGWQVAVVATGVLAVGAVLGSAATRAVATRER